MDNTSQTQKARDKERIEECLTQLNSLHGRTLEWLDRRMKLPRGLETNFTGSKNDDGRLLFSLTIMDMRAGTGIADILNDVESGVMFQRMNDLERLRSSVKDAKEYAKTETSQGM